MPKIDYSKTYIKKSEKPLDFSDGEKIGTGTYLLGKLGSGVVSGFVGTYNLIAGGIDQLTGNTYRAQKRYANDFNNQMNRELDEAYGKEATGATKFASGALEGVGQNLPRMAISFIPVVGAPVAAGLALTGYTGQGVSEAYNESGRLGGKEYLYGVATGTMDTVLETVAGKAGGWLGNTGAGKLATSGLGKIGEGAAKAATKVVGAGAGNIIGKAVAGGASEFAEEFIEAYAEVGLKRALDIDPNASVTFGEALYAGAVGFASGGILSGGTAAVNTAAMRSVGKKIQRTGEQENVYKLGKEIASSFSPEGKIEGEFAKGLDEQLKLYDSITDKNSDSAAVVLGNINAYAETLRAYAQQRGDIRKIISNPEKFLPYVRALFGNNITAEELKNPDSKYVRYIAAANWATGATQAIAIKQNRNEFVRQAEMASKGLATVPGVEQSSEWNGDTAYYKMADGRFANVYKGGNGYTVLVSSIGLNGKLDTDNASAVAIDDKGTTVYGEEEVRDILSSMREDARTAQAQATEEQAEIAEEATEAQEDADTESNAATEAENGLANGEETEEEEPKREEPVKEEKKKIKLTEVKGGQQKERLLSEYKEATIEKSRKIIGKAYDTLSAEKRIAIAATIESAEQEGVKVDEETLKAACIFEAGRSGLSIIFNSELPEGKLGLRQMIGAGYRVVATSRGVKSIRETVAHEIFHDIFNTRAGKRLGSYALSIATNEDIDVIAERYSKEFHAKNESVPLFSSFFKDGKYESKLDAVLDYDKMLREKGVKQSVAEEIAAKMIGAKLGTKQFMSRLAGESNGKAILSAFRRMGAFLRAKKDAKPMLLEVNRLENLYLKAVEQAGVIDRVKDYVGEGQQFNLATWEDKTILTEDGVKSGKEILFETLKKNGWRKEDSEKLIEDVQSVADVMKLLRKNYKVLDGFAEIKPHYRNDGSLMLSCVVKNGEYELNVDFTTICKRREALARFLSEYVESGHDFGKKGFDKASQAYLENMFRKYGLDTACSICFVEARRKNVDTWSAKFVRLWNEALKYTGMTANTDISAIEELKGIDVINGITDDVAFSVASAIEGEALAESEAESVMEESLKEAPVPGKPSKARAAYIKYYNERRAGGKKASPNTLERMLQYISEHQNELYAFKTSDLVNTRVISYVKAKMPDLYSIFLTSYGANSPKQTLPATPYAADAVLDSEFKKREDLTAASIEMGGVRLNSFSDFQITRVLDYFQLVADLTARGSAVQTYTKELAMVELFGLSGLKINMSLVPEIDMTVDKNHAGLNAAGEYILSADSADAKKAFELQERDGMKGDVGTVLVGISKYQIIKALNDDRIKMIIPYHSSGMPKHLRLFYNHDLYTDYQKVQSTRQYNTNNGKTTLGAVEGGDPFMKVFYGYYTTHGGDYIGATKAYLDHCKEKGLVPRFAMEWDKNKSFEENINSEGNYIVSNPNYYKVLIDFTSDAGDGKFKQQKAVRLNIEGVDVKGIVERESKLLEESIRTYEEAKGNMFEEFQQAVNGTLKPGAIKADRDARIAEENAKYAVDDVAQYDLDDSYEDKIYNVEPASREESKELDINDPRNVARIVQEISNALEGEMETNELVMFGKPSKALADAMKSDNPLYMPQKSVKKVASADGKHKMNRIVLYNLAYHIADPMAITGNTTKHELLGDKSVVVWTDWMTKKGDSIIVPIRIDVNGLVGTYNNINTTFDAYDEEYVKDLLRDGNIIYTRKNKSIEELFKQRREVPEFVSINASDNRISQSDEIVNPISENSSDSQNDLDISDTDYLSAVERGDMETAQRMVDEKAKAAGFTAKLFHGTKSFGFTRFDLSKMDDKQSIFLTDNPLVAESYSGTTEVRPISEKLRWSSDGKSDSQIIEKYNELFNHEREIRLATEEDIAKMKERYENDIKDDIDSLRVLANISKSEDVMNGMHLSESDKNILRMLGDLYLKSSSMEAIDIAKEYKEIVNKVDYRGFLPGIISVWVKGEGFSNSARFQKYLNDLIASGDTIVKDGDYIRSIESVKSRIDEYISINTNENIGNYSVFADLGKILTIDAAGHNFDNLELPNKLKKFATDSHDIYYTTREISDIAKNAGYDSVKFEEIVDVGEDAFDMYESDVYVVFDPANIKSADPVTYDDNGNVIPLSQRFNRGEEDIRFDLDTESMISTKELEKEINEAGLYLKSKDNNTNNRKVRAWVEENHPEIAELIFENDKETGTVKVKFIFSQRQVEERQRAFVERQRAEYQRQKFFKRVSTYSGRDALMESIEKHVNKEYPDLGIDVHKSHSTVGSLSFYVEFYNEKTEEYTTIKISDHNTTGQANAHPDTYFLDLHDFESTADVWKDVKEIIEKRINEVPDAQFDLSTEEQYDLTPEQVKANRERAIRDYYSRRAKADKWYRKGDVRYIADHILSVISSDLSDQDVLDKVRLSGKDRNAAIDYFTNKLNTTSKNNQGNIAREFARYIMNHAVVESIITDDAYMEEVERAERILNVLGSVRHNIDLSTLKENGEIKYMFDDKAGGIYLQWQASNGRGVGVDQVATMLAEEGVNIYAENEADIFKEIMELYKESRGIVEGVKEKMQLSAYGNESMREEVLNKTANRILAYLDETGVYTDAQKALDRNIEVIDSVKEAYNAKISDLQESLASAIIKARSTGMIAYIAKDFADTIQKRTGIPAGKLDMPEATAAADLARKVWDGRSGKIDSAKAREVCKILQGFYTPAIIDGESYQQGEDGEHATMYNQSIADAIANIASGEGDLTAVETAELLGIMRAIRHLYRTFDTAFFNGKRESITKKATEEIKTQRSYIDYVNKKTESAGKLKTFFSRAGKFIQRNYLYGAVTPRQVIQSFEYYDKDGVMTQIFEDIQNGYAASMSDYADMMKPIIEYVENHKGLEKHLTKETVNIMGADLTFGQAISLLLTARREQAVAGLETNGFTYMGIDGIQHHIPGVGEGKIDDLKNSIETALTSEDKEYIKIVNDILTKAGEMKKATDNMVFGFTNVEGTYYYPIRRSDSARAIKVTDVRQLMSETAVLGSGQSFNKRTVKGANAELMIDDVTSIVSRHANGVSLYANLYSPMQTWDRVWNKNVDGETVRKLVNENQFQIKGKMGQADFYLRNLFRDVQGIKDTKQIGDEVFANLRASFVSATLGINLSSTLKQMGSFGTALVYLNPTDLVHGLAMRAKKDDVFKYSKVANGRMFDKSRIVDQSANTTAGEVKNAVRKFGNITTLPVEMMDNQVVFRLWNACRYHVMKNSGFALDTEENMIEAGKLLDKVVRETQSTSTPETRSAFQRSANPIMQTFTMFTSDAVKQVSNIYEGIMRVKTANMRKQMGIGSEAEVKSSWKFLGRANVGLVSATAITVAVIEFIKWALKKDREDSVPKELALTTMGEVIGYLPFISTAYSAFFEGYDVDNFFYDNINGLIDSTKQVSNVLKKVSSGEAVESYEYWRPFRKLCLSVADISGIPARNANKYATSLAKSVIPKAGYWWDDNRLNGSAYGDDLDKLIASGSERKALAALDLSIKNGRTGEVVDTDAASEMVSLLKSGYDVLGNEIPTTYTIDGSRKKTTQKQYKQMQKVYAGANSAVKEIVASEIYEGLPDEERADAIKRAYNSYLSRAKEEALGIEGTKASVMLRVISNGNLFSALAHIANIEGDDDEKRSDKVAAYLNSLKLSNEEKYCILYAAGYHSASVIEGVSKAVKKSEKLSEEEKQEVLQKLQ